MPPPAAYDGSVASEAKTFKGPRAQTGGIAVYQGIFKRAIVVVATLAVAALALAGSHLPAGATESQVAIVYFSLGRNSEGPQDVDASTAASLVAQGGELVGTTEFMALRIQEKLGGDLYSLRTLEPYPSQFDAVVDQNHDERDRRFMPELAPLDLDLSKYSTIFIGYPVWAASAPRAVFSFLAQYDLSGKTLIPFCSHDGYGAGSSYRDIASAVPGAGQVLRGLAVEASQVPASEEAIGQWLESLDLQPRAETQQRGLRITVDGVVLEGVLFDTALARDIQQHFPLTLTMGGYGGREYYGAVEFYPDPRTLEGGQRHFENGHITYCQDHHNMAIFYAQTDNPRLSVDVFPIGRVTSDLAIFDDLPRRIQVTFDLTEQ